MKATWIALTLVIALFLTSCAKGYTCEKPFIIVDGECCTDANKNLVCDKDEGTEEPIPEPEEPNLPEPITLSIQACMDSYGPSKDRFGASYYLDGFIHVIFNIDVTEQEAKEILENYGNYNYTLKNYGASYIYMKIHVPFGSEAEWACRLKENPKIESAYLEEKGVGLSVGFKNILPSTEAMALLKGYGLSEHYIFINSEEEIGEAGIAVPDDSVIQWLELLRAEPKVRYAEGTQSAQGYE